MKLIHGILGCALVAGLTTFASSMAQAGTVIENTLLTPLNLKLQIRYNDSKGKVRKAMVTSKDLLKLLGYPSKYELAVDYDGFGDEADVFVLNKDTIVTDLTEDDIMSISFDDIPIYHDKNGKNGSYSEAEKGIINLSFELTEEPSGIVANGEEEPIDEVSFEASGVYFWKESGASVKNGKQKISTTLAGTEISGSGFDSDLVPAIKADVSEDDGDFLILHGKADGTGSGTVEIDL